MAKAATRTSIITDQKYLGREPEFDGSVVSGAKLITALNWYNYFKDTDNAKQYLQDYCKAKSIKISTSRHTTNTFGWIARMATLGATFDEATTDSFNDYLNSIKPEPKKAVEQTEERVINRLSQWMPDFEEAVDNYNDDFDCYNYIRSNNIPQTYVKQIAEYYMPVANEILAAYEKSDKELVDAYRNHTRTSLKALSKRVLTIIEDCNKFLGNVKKERKPRKKRAKSVESTLKHFKYLQHDDNLKLSSDDPSKIIGASAAYILNTSTNILTVFHAANADGLNISRTSICNYDPAKSRCKRVGRARTMVIEAITGGTKKTRVKVIDSVKTADAKFTDRLNENSLIIKVDK